MLSGRTRAFLHFFLRAAHARSAENLQKIRARFGTNIAPNFWRRRCTRVATSRNFRVELECFSWSTPAERAHFCISFCARRARVRRKICSKHARVSAKTFASSVAMTPHTRRNFARFPLPKLHAFRPNARIFACVLARGACAFGGKSGGKNARVSAQTLRVICSDGAAHVAQPHEISPSNSHAFRGARSPNARMFA